MIDPISISILTVIGILLLSFLCCTVCVVICCPFSFLFFFLPSALIAACSGWGRRRGGHRSLPHYSSSSNNTHSYPNEMQIHLAEAYLVAPLADAHIISADMPVQQNITTQEATPLPKVVFHDAWAACLFVVQMIVVVWLCVRVTLKATHVTDTSSVHAQGLATIATAAGCLALIATIMGTVALSILLTYSEYIIEGVMWFTICGLVTAAVVVASSNLMFAMILAFLGLLNYWYLRSVRPRIAFASSVLAASCQAIKSHYLGIITAAYVMLVVQVAWVITWALGSYGVYLSFVSTSSSNNSSSTQNNGETTSQVNLDPGQIAAIVGLFLSFHWTSETFKGVLQSTVGGTIACWWFQPRRENVVRGALFRSVTTSFGSICLGGLLVAAVHTIRDILQLLANRNRGADGRRARSGSELTEFITACADCLLAQIEALLRYFNKYALSYVAAYGLGFIESARKVTTLFESRGWEAIINDNLASNALMFAVIMMTLLMAVAGVVLSLFMGPSLTSVGFTSPAAVLGILGGVIGFGVCNVITHALNSGIAMVFVCLAESPDALKDNHPHVFDRLTSTWYQFYPMTCIWMQLPPSGGGPGGGGGGYRGGYSPMHTQQVTTTQQPMAYQSSYAPPASHHFPPPHNASHPGGGYGYIPPGLPPSHEGTGLDYPYNGTTPAYPGIGAPYTGLSTHVDSITEAQAAPLFASPPLAVATYLPPEVSNLQYPPSTTNNNSHTISNNKQAVPSTGTGLSSPPAATNHPSQPSPSIPTPYDQPPSAPPLPPSFK